MLARLCRKTGFTLVELSIVLVVIGLLIGGVLVAQSMISTARIAAVSSQIQQFDAGVMNFKTKFNYLPGDAPGFGGDGDGVIDYESTHAVNQFDEELATFWSCLFPQDYVAGQVTPGPQPAGALKNVPASKLGQSNPYFIASAIMPAGSTYFADRVNPRNFYAILNSSYYINTFTFNKPAAGTASLKPAELLALDTKMDNGVANSGNVLSGNIGDVVPDNGGIALTPSAACSVGANYIVANNSYECTPLIRIGGQTGYPQ